MLSMLDEILWLLKDGKWHSLREIITKCSSQEPIVNMAVSFLREFDFVQLDEQGQKVRLQPLTLGFIDEIQRVEREKALSH